VTGRGPSRAIAPGLVFFLAAGLGCGKKGDPRPPLRPTPATIAGLRLAQRGDQVEIRFTAPRASTDGSRLSVLEIELFVADHEGEFAKVSRSRRFKAAPGEVLTETEPLPAPGTLLRAAARASARGHRGALPEPARLVVVAPLAAPSGLATELVGEGVALAWQGEVPAPLPTPTPTPTPTPAPGTPVGSEPPATLPPAPGARVPPEPTPSTTPEVPLGSQPAALPPPAPGAPVPPGSTPSTTPEAALGSPPPATPPPAPGARVPPEPTTPTPTPPPFDPGFFIYKRQAQGTYLAPLQPTATAEHAFVDRTAVPGESSCYTVRAAASADPLVESVASNEACVDVKDVLAPTAPSGLTALPREDGIELSWSPSPESDLAAYRVYRTAARGTAELVGELPRTETSFLDKEAPSGRLRYSVSAVDASGNESAKSPPVEARIP
jgi:hypothetical protein